MGSKAILNLGISFAELATWDANSSKLNFKKFYLPQENIHQGLKKAWAEFGTPEKLIVSSRYLERILDAKLGGTVAQITTKGFETWPILRQPVSPPKFSLSIQRQEALASQDLIFGLSERLNSKGEIISPLDLAELESVNKKLKTLGVKRVCVNLLFSSMNRAHQDQVCAFFKEQGFEVFGSSRPEKSSDEMPAWRKNVINACLSGAFTELTEEIQKSFNGSKVEIQYLNSEGRLFFEDKNSIASSLFAWSTMLGKHFQEKYSQILFLDLEGWFLISTRSQSQFWESPWGLIETSAPKIRKLKIQPTQEMTTSFWGGLSPSSTELGFEPGPMTFGRAHRPMVFDFLSQNYQIQLPQMTASGVAKLKDQMTATLKNKTDLQRLSFEQLSKELSRHVIQSIASECHFLNSDESQRWVVTGFFAPYFSEDLKKNWIHGDLTIDQNAEQVLSQSLMNSVRMML